MNSYNLDPSLIHKKENRYFVLALVFSVFMYLSLFISIIGLFIIPVLVLIPLFAQALMMANIRTNGVRISPGQFPEVFATVQEQCAKMGFSTVPDVYVMESSGILNAFASRFFGRNMVVLYSDLFELIESGGSRELTFVITHELAHIKRNHLTKQLLIFPALWFPFIGEAYSRACEYTCDRMAAYFTNDAEAAMNGLTILAIGKTLYKRVDREQYLIQSSQEKGLFVWLAEKLSTHPPLPKRIYAIQQFVGVNSSAVFKSSKIGLIVLLSAVVIFMGAISIGVLFSDSIVKLTETLAVTVSADELLTAASDGDLEAVQSMLEYGTDPNVADDEGWTALMWAAQLNDTAIASALIEAGADPNLQDSYGWTPLMSAAANGNYEATELLLDAGANPAITDDSEMTAADYALENGYDDIAALLQEIGEQI